MKGKPAWVPYAATGGPLLMLRQMSQQLVQIASMPFPACRPVSSEFFHQGSAWAHLSSRVVACPSKWNGDACAGSSGVLSGTRLKRPVQPQFVVGLPTRIPRLGCRASFIPGGSSPLIQRNVVCCSSAPGVFLSWSAAQPTLRAYDSASKPVLQPTSNVASSTAGSRCRCRKVWCSQNSSP